MRLRLRIMVLPAFAIAAAAHAYSAIITIEDLAAGSRVIVLARVASVREVRARQGIEKHAKATILEAWKGSHPGQAIEYIASPGWFSCDTSDARIGETIVLFLERDDDAKMYRIAHFGRGRMQLHTLEGTLHAAIHEVTFPAGVVTKQLKYPYQEVVTLADLKKMVVGMSQLKPVS